MADLHPHNLLVNGDQLHVIDFDDSGFGWHQYEIAVALDAYRKPPHFEVARDALIAGYRSERPLSDAAIELLPMFLLIRSLALLGWLHERPEHNRGESGAEPNPIRLQTSRSTRDIASMFIYGELEK